MVSRNRFLGKIAINYAICFQLFYLFIFTFERKSLLRVADFPFEDWGSFAAALASSLAFTGLTAASPLASALGGSGGGGGGAGIPLGAAGGSDTCATYSEQTRHFSAQRNKKLSTVLLLITSY